MAPFFPSRNEIISFSTEMTNSSAFWATTKWFVAQCTYYRVQTQQNSDRYIYCSRSFFLSSTRESSFMNKTRCSTYSYISMHHPAPLSTLYNLLTDSSIRSSSHQRKCIKYSMEFPFVVYRRCSLCCHIAPFIKSTMQICHSPWHYSLCSATLHAHTFEVNIEINSFPRWTQSTDIITIW